MERRTESFDKYRFVARIGTGGMADVYLAVLSGPEGFHRLLVVKKLRPDLAGDAKFRAMLLAEARLAARLHHPNIVQTLDVGEHDGGPTIAMEYLDGQPLGALVQSEQRAKGLLDPAFSAMILSEALGGLHYAHELADYDGTPLAIVHRDVSPQNVFVTYEGEVKIVDFGIAKAALAEIDTDVGVLKGKLAYMAPEQMRGEPLDRRADLFAMGVVLWELCTQERLFASDNPVTTMNKVLAGRAPPPSSVAPGVDAELDAICARALQVDRQARFQTAAEMRHALERWLDHAHQHGARRDLIAQRMCARFAADRARIEQRIQSAMLSAHQRWSRGVVDSDAPPILRLEAADEPSPDDLTRRDVPAPVSRTTPSPPSATPAPLSSRTGPSPPADTGRGPGRRRALLGLAALGAVVAAAVVTATRRGPVTTNDSAAPVASDGAALSSAPPVAPVPEVVLRLRGSNTVGAALAPALAEAFLQHEGAGAVERTPAPVGRGVVLSATLPRSVAKQAITIASEGSATAFEGLLDGSCDIGMASRPIKPDEAARLEQKGVGQMRSSASEHVVALDGIAVIVHPNNPLHSIARADLRRVFAGEITDWSALGAPALPIAVQARDDASGTFDTFKLLVLGEQALAPGAKRFSDSNALSDAVAAEPSAIGFIGVAYVRNARAVAISDTGSPAMLPSAFTVTTEEYLLSRRLYLYSPAQPKNPFILRFVDFALSEAGQRVVRAAGFVDLGVELESEERCAGRCSPGYAARIRHARRVSVEFRFRTGTEQLDSRGVRDLDRLVAFLRSHSGARLMLLGFSDDMGDAAKSLAASRARAGVVEAELAERGVRAALVEGRGAEMPVASNADEAGRERNRRVEVWLAEGS